MRIIFSLLGIILTGFNAQTQFLAKAPGIQWQRCLGGTGEDFLDDERPNFYIREQKPLIATSDGGYILGGNVRSNDGDVNNNHGASDIWLLRIDKEGNTIWKKTYGGSANEFIGGIQETTDHGFVIAGSTNSNNGDVSGNKGALDYWIFRIDKDGNLLWQKCYGGSGRDKAYSLVIAPDNSIGVLGVTHSYNGDITTSHMPNDSTDVWVVKLDASGGLLWQKSLGGNNLEEGVSIDNSGDGGFVIAANTFSNDGDVIGNHGRSDIWVVKLNGTGAVAWARCYGGTQDEFVGRIKKTADNGFIIAGMAESVNGDVSFQRDNSFFEAADAWILKISATGVPVWNKCYGDVALEETLYDITELPNGGYAASGFASLASFSSIGLPSDAMIMEINSTGAVVWMNAFGSLGEEYGHAVVKAHDDGFLMLGTTSGDNTNSTGDPGIPNHVSGVKGGSDLWLVKFGQRNKIGGTVFLDNNKNGIKDTDEPLLDGIRIRSLKGTTATTSVSVNGVFVNDVDSGSYTTTALAGNYYTVVPASKVSTFANFNGNEVINFALQSAGSRRDLAIAGLPITIARPGFDLVYRLYYKNNGTDTIPTGTIRFVKDPGIDFIAANPAQDEIKGDTILWNYSNFRPFDAGFIQLQLKVKAPPIVNNGDTLSSLALITPLEGDLTPSDDSAYLNQPVVGSYDPNDKTENLSGQISKREVGSNAYINYLIRFQNTGTDTAFRVRVRDTLDSQLDWQSFEMLSASHGYALKVTGDNKLEWNFNDINLVDSNRNEPASHGYISYRIRPKSTLTVGDVIRNKADIYFDYNLPVTTNIQETEVVLYSINNPQAGVPTISSFTPGSAGSGATISITGTNFTGATAVSFGGIAATSFSVNSATSITAVVGAGASGNITVTASGGTATLAGFTFIPAPTIISFTPTSAATAASITITGTNFTETTAVSFGGVAAASFTVNSATSITAILAAGASGDVRVTSPGGTATLAGFTFIPVPTITTFTPTNGGAATSVTITGTNFTGATAVSFGGTPATSFTVNSATSITAVVGAGASGNVSVVTPGGTATLAGFTYTVVTAIDPVPANSLGIRFYPNPTTGSFFIDTLKLSDKWETLEIFDTQGKKKLSNFAIRNKTRVNVNVEYLSNGLYMAILKRRSGPATVIKFLKR